MRTNSRYTSPPEAPITRWARHIDAVRRERNLSQTATFRLLREAVDLGSESRSAFLPYLVDKEPEESQAKRLAAIIGWPPVETEPQPDPLIGTTPDLATALADLARELAANREERTALAAQVEKLTATVDRLLEGTLGPRGSEAREGNGAPRGSAA